MYRRHTAPRAALRELLEATLEWNGPAGPGRTLTHAGVRYRLTPLTAGGDGAAVLCESAHHAPIPDYRTRRVLRSRIGDRVRSNLMIFTDSAHSHLVWSWVALGSMGERVYRELSIRPGEAWGPLRPVLESIGSAQADGSVPFRVGDGEEPAADVSATRLLTALAHRIDALDRDPAGGVEWAQMIHDTVAAAADPDGIRACWRALLASRVIDPDCGDGEWLAMALDALVPAYEACLQRMDIALEDLRRIRPAPRRDRLADFARLSARSGGARQTARRRRFATELALLHNLFGSDDCADAVLRTRRRLVSRLDAPAVPAPPELLSLNVLHAPDTSCGDGGQRPVATDRSELPGRAEDVGDGCNAPGPDVHGTTGEISEDEVVWRAVSTILRMHLEGAVEIDGLARALDTAGRRLAAAQVTGGERQLVCRRPAAGSVGLILTRAVRRSAS